MAGPNRKTLFVQAGVCLPILALLVLLSLTGCDKKADPVSERKYDLKGKVTAVDQNKKSVTIDHEAIPGYMQAMEMEFSVENSQLLDGVAVGDPVEGQLTVRSGQNVVTELHKR